MNIPFSALRLLTCTCFAAMLNCAQAQNPPNPAPAVPAPAIAQPIGTVSKTVSTMGVHGMALFGGKDALFASHLPMFHAPHDYQVLLQIKLSDARLDQSVRSALESNPTLWTIEPEPFELTQINAETAPLRSFKAQLYQGHFERGGKLANKNVAMQIQSVILFKPLDGKKRVSESAEYRLLQTGGTAYLVKLLNQRPDFDQIIKLRLLSDKPSMTTNIAVQNRGLAVPKAKLLEAAMRASLVPAQVQTTVYFETNDLQ